MGSSGSAARFYRPAGGLLPPPDRPAPDSPSDDRAVELFTEMTEAQAAGEIPVPGQPPAQALAPGARLTAAEVDIQVRMLQRILTDAQRRYVVLQLDCPA
jgi:hypothetical protein